MKILQCGYDKSGNYWLWKILEATLDAAGIERHSFIRNQAIYPLAKSWELSFPEQAEVDMIAWRSAGKPRMDSYWWTILPMFKRRIQDLDEYIDQTSHAWSHSPFGPATPACLSRFDKVVYIIRDPRDIALSFADFMVTPFYLREYAPPAQAVSFEQRVRRTSAQGHKRWQQHVTGWLRQREACNVHCIFYERLVDNFDLEFRRLLDYLELDLDSEAVTAVYEATRIQSMRKKNFGHVNKGKTGRWLRDMPDSCARQITVDCFELLGYLGYSRDVDGGEISTPGPLTEPLPERLGTVSQRRRTPDVPADIQDTFEEGFEDF